MLQFRSLLFAVIAYLALSLSNPAASLAQTSTSTPPGFTLVWTKPVPPLLALDMSPQGNYTAMIAQGGKLILWSSDGPKPIWSVTGITAHDLAVSDEMGYVLLYDQMNRVNQSVTLYRSRTVDMDSTSPAPLTPLLVMKHKVPGAVWSAAVSLDGSHAACGTGNREVCLFDLDLRPKMTSHPIDGICNDLQFANNNQFLAIGLWNQSGVETMDMQGRIRWSYLASNDRRYSVTIEPDSRKVLAVSYLNHRSSDPVLTLLDDQGAVRWSYPLGAQSYQANIQLGSAAQVCYASYTQVVKHGRDLEPERSIVALGPLGDLLWTKGGLFFSPTLLCLSRDGSGLIAYDGAKTLYRLDMQGRILARYKLPAELELWAVSRDHKRLVVYTSDGQLTMTTIQ